MADVITPAHLPSPVDVVENWYKTLDADLLSETIEWKVLDTFPSGGCYRGRAEVFERFFPAVRACFASYKTTLGRIIGNGETVIATGSYLIESHSGTRAEIAFAHVWAVRGGAIVSFQQIADTVAVNAMLV